MTTPQQPAVIHLAGNVGNAGNQPYTGVCGAATAGTRGNTNMTTMRRQATCAACLAPAAQHYLTWPTSSSAACGADMVGRRNSRLDSDPAATSCPRCLAWLADNVAEARA